MRGSLMVGMLLTLLAGGCAPTFHGEWIEERGSNTHRIASEDTGLSRMALQFDGLSTVRVGRFSEAGGVVDNKSVQPEGYFLFDGFQTAQFGEMIARLDGHDRLTTTVNGEIDRRFIRVKGRSIFPPHVKIPPLASGG